jgi:hypothetical protein
MSQAEFKARLDLIEENIKKVNQEVQQGLANLNLLEGGKRECIHWMNNLETPQQEVDIQIEELSEIEPVFIPKEEQLDEPEEVEEDKKSTTF